MISASGPEVIEFFSFSAQLSMKCSLLKDVKIKKTNFCSLFNINEQNKLQAHLLIKRGFVGFARRDDFFIVNFKKTQVKSTK